MEASILERSMSSDPSVWPILSFSQLGAWDRCEYAWNLGYVQNWVPIRKSPALSIGSMIHRGFEIYYTHAPDYALARTEIKTFFAELVKEAYANDESQLQSISRAMYCVEMYFQWAPKEDKGHTILATEHHFVVPFKTGKRRNFYIQGYIDLLTSWNNRLWAWDHKSSEGKFWTPTEVMMDPQLPLYAACLREIDTKVHGYFINMINTYDYKDKSKVTVDKLFRRESAYRTDLELNNILTEIKYMVDDLIENGETPRRSMRRDCSKCQFADPCLMDLKGIDPTPFLMQKFNQKEKYDVDVLATQERFV
jgi:hypothetical protein